MLFSALLVHGLAPDDMVSGTLIPIPKGKNVNVTDSSNYRAIALSSIFGKVFDFIFLHKFYMCLCTTEQQFGFKRCHSTDMCTIVLTETLSYYTVDGGVAFSTLLQRVRKKGVTLFFPVTPRNSNRFSKFFCHHSLH